MFSSYFSQIETLSFSIKSAAIYLLHTYVLSQFSAHSDHNNIKQQPSILTRLFFPVYWGQPHLWPSHNIFLHLDLSQASSLQSPFSLISSLNTSLHLFWAYLSLHHHLPAVSQFSLSNTTHLFSQHGQTISACFVAWLHQCHQLPACSSPTHCLSFHLNSLLPSISTSSFHSSAFSLYPLSLLAISHCHTTLQVLCMLYR